MPRSLTEQGRDFRAAVSELVKKYQFRDRNETVAYGLSVSQAYALSALDGRGPLRMGELAAELQLSVSATTRVVDSLAARHLVQRSADASDRRICRVALTSRGTRLWRRIEAELLASEADVLRALAPSEREATIRALRLLARATDAWRARTAEEP
jgi:MarR family 2-MHQ and catechol resistance regulon transcriptional repressor